MAEIVLPVICLILCAVTVVQGWGPPSNGMGMAALISFLLLEMRATPLSLGTFSPAPCWAVALVSLKTLSAPWVLVCLAFAVSVRTLMLPPSPNGRMRDALVDFVPAALAAAAAAYFGIWKALPILAVVAVPLPVALSHLLAPRSRAGKARSSLKLEQLAMVTLGPVAGQLGQSHPLLMLTVWPSIFSLLKCAYTGDELELRRSQHLGLRRAETRVNRQEQQVVQTGARQEELQRLLDARADAFTLLETLSSRPLTEAQAVAQVLKALQERFPQGEWLFLAQGAFQGTMETGVHLQQVWEDGCPWASATPTSTEAAWRLQQNGLFYLRGPFRLGSEWLHTLGVFFYYLNIWLERIRFQERILVALQQNAAMVTRLGALLQGSHQLATLVAPREVLELLVDNASLWTGRPCGIAFGDITVGRLEGQTLPFPLGTFWVDPQTVDPAELEALRLWVLLGNSALERCQAQASLHQNSKLAAIGQLAAGVAHELNTPLGAISVALGLAVKNLEKNPEKASSRLGLAQKSVEQMRNIVAKLLNYSRSSDHERRVISLGEIATDSLQLIDQSFQMEGVELILAPGGEECLVEANAGEIQQVLLNLLVNARLALTGQAQGKVRVSLGPGRIQVDDNGPGISPENLQRVFEPFFTTRELGQGVGLGLSISREIATSHGGDLSYRPSELGGACFVVTLPGVEE